MFKIDKIETKTDCYRDCKLVFISAQLPFRCCDGSVWNYTGLPYITR